MPVRLILHADDFGLTAGINRGVLELFEAGALSSASLMVTAPAAEQAAELARACPGFGVGCHLLFVDGVPAAKPDSIPTLLGPDRKTLHTSVLSFAQAWLRGAIDPSDVAREADAQLRRMASMGLRVTHVDTHKHLHALPGLARAVLQTVRQRGVPAVRLPFEPAWAVRQSRAPFLRRLEMHSLSRMKRRFEGLPEVREAQLLTTGGTLGMAATGSLDEAVLRATLEAAIAHGGEQAWELCCHPGYADEALSRVRTRLRRSREIELRALLAVVPEMRRTRSEVRIIHYGELDGLAPNHRQVQLQGRRHG